MIKLGKTYVQLEEVRSVRVGNDIIVIRYIDGSEVRCEEVPTDEATALIKMLDFASQETFATYERQMKAHNKP